MARGPSMTVDEAESILGNPSNFVVTAANRGTLRKWAVAKGIPANRAYAMSIVELTNMYHQQASATGRVSAIRSDLTMPAEPMPVQPATAPQKDAGQALAELIQRLAAGQGAIDPEDVRAIVREELDALPKREAVTVLEVRTPAAVHRIVGAVHYMTETVIKVVALGHPVMLVGPAGCGKTRIGEHVAEALGLPVMITPTVFDTHELLGFVDGMGNYHSTPFRQAFEHGGLWIADEVDAWDAAALLAANSALANGFTTFPDSATPVRRHADFRMVATANTFGNGADRIYVGRNELDAASLDRFATIDVDYDMNLETQFAGGVTDWLNRVWQVRKAVTDKHIRHVVSSRAIIMGTAALAAGIDRDTVEKLYLFKGMSANDRAKIN